MAEISLNRARKIVRAALSKGKEQGFKPLSVVVLDSGGHVKAFEREDGASPGRFGIAHGKAYGSIMLGIAGRAQMARAENQAYFMTAMNGLYSGQLVPVPGGVLVRDSSDRIVGAGGVTGDTSDNDVIAAVAGIEAANLKAEE